jgi:anti-anti-sigma factor
MLRWQLVMVGAHAKAAVMESVDTSDIQITDRLLPNCVVLDVTAQQFVYPQSMLLKNHIAKLHQEGHFRLVLNLTNVQQMDSFALASIISALKSCQAQGGKLNMYGLQPAVEQLMKLTHMDRVLDIWISEAQAVSQI